MEMGLMSLLEGHLSFAPALSYLRLALFLSQSTQIKVREVHRRCLTLYQTHSIRMYSAPMAA